MPHTPAPVKHAGASFGPAPASHGVRRSGTPLATAADLWPLPRSPQTWYGARMKSHMPAFGMGLVLLLSASGCVSSYTGTRTYDPAHARRPPPHVAPRLIKPLVTVTAFENKSGFSGQWKLGEGMAEMLVTSLMDTRQVTVVDRRNLQDVVGELMRQGQNLFRPEGRVDSGRLKNAQYLVRGAITDFSITGDVSGWFSLPTIRSWFGGQAARVSLHLSVVDVESGEIVASARAYDTARSGFFGADVDYRKVNFGGDAFFATPLGRATEGAIADAVDRVLAQLPTRYWEPRVAEVTPENVVILNGGENVDLKAGDLFLVRGPPRNITDPITGDVIESFPGQPIGRLKVQTIKPASAYAVMIEGQAVRGAYLEPLNPPR